MNTRISISSPCNASWSTMSGDERRRLCGQCSKHVHDLSAMDEEEAEALVANAKGRLCVRFQPDAQGNVVHRRRSRWARWGVAALAGLVGAPALASGSVDVDGEGMGAWIAEVVASMTERAKAVIEPEPMIMGEMAMESEPRAFDNRTDGPLVVDCGLEKAVIEPGTTATLEAWAYQTCSIQGEHTTVQIEANDVLCTRRAEGFSCAPALD